MEDVSEDIISGKECQVVYDENEYSPHKIYFLFSELAEKEGCPNLGAILRTVAYGAWLYTPEGFIQGSMSFR